MRVGSVSQSTINFNVFLNRDFSVPKLAKFPQVENLNKAKTLENLRWL